MTAITDKHVQVALRAYESLPEHSGREARMKAALEAVTAGRARSKTGGEGCGNGALQTETARAAPTDPAR